jgi:putative membrane protein
MKHILFDFGRGLLMGSADVIPGVSGGTMALVTGIYERLVACASHAFGAAVKLARLDVGGFKQEIRLIEWRLVLPVGAGIAMALALGAGIIPDLLRTYPEECRGLFLGLILGSLPIPWLRIRQRTQSDLVLAAIGATVAFVLVGLPDRVVTDPSMMHVFAVASVAICAMILPGVSGAFLLVVFGLYETTLDALHTRDWIFVAVFAGGAAVGLGLFSQLLNWLLEHRHDHTMAVLVGLMAGSLRALWPWLADDRSIRLPPDSEGVAAVMGLALFGLVLVLGLGLWGHRSQKQST